MPSFAVGEFQRATPVINRFSQNQQGALDTARFGPRPTVRTAERDPEIKHIHLLAWHPVFSFYHLALGSDPP